MKMNAITVIFWASCAVLFIVPLYFVRSKVYKDGVVGRIALLVVSFVGASYLFELIADEMLESPPPPRMVWLMAAVSAFLVWHALKFYFRTHPKNSHPNDRRCLHDRRFDPDDTNTRGAA